MTQAQPFSAYGAVDLSSLKRPAAPPPGAPQQGAGRVVVDVTEATFQAEVIDRSATVPVVIDFWAAWCQPCKQLSPILERLAEDDGGQWVLAKIDIDANQRLAAAAGVQSIPLVLAVIGGRLMPLFNGALPEAQVRQVLDQMLEVARENGVSGRIAPEPGTEPPASEPPPDPLAEAADLLAAGDLDAAQAKYEEVLAQQSGDPDAAQGLAVVGLVRRIEGIDPAAVRARADAHPTDVDLQCQAADLELSIGDAPAAFNRLIATVRGTRDDDRERARTHLIMLFQVVGPTDPSVVAARSALASALF